MFGEIHSLRGKLSATIDSLDPDVIITFGPEAESGHPDHRLVGAVTTEIVLREEYPGDMRLYYFSYTKEQADKYVGWNLNYADKSNMNTVITFSDEDKEKYIESIRCHKTQYPEQAMEVWIQWERSDSSNTLYFREHVHSSELRNGF